MKGKKGKAKKMAYGGQALSRGAGPNDMANPGLSRAAMGAANANPMAVSKRGFKSGGKVRGGGAAKRGLKFKIC